MKTPLPDGISFLPECVVELEELFEEHASVELSTIYIRALEDDRDLFIGAQALKAALIRAYTAGQLATERCMLKDKLAIAPRGWGFYPDPDKPGYLKMQRPPHFDKGPRPYYVTAAEAARREKEWREAGGEITIMLGEKPLDKRFSILHDGVELDHSVIAPGDEPEWALQRHVDALTTIEAQEGDKGGAATQTDDERGPCPHERMDDDGGPPRRDWDDFPKVGFVDFAAITRSVSGG